ncbi:MAG TPA: PaaI family thioesterase [Alphaproteobacteria bacterium]|nr:PaaI family thioesterase [Alphaproteobacteria bacterium]
MTGQNAILALGYQAIADSPDPFEHIIGPFYERRESGGGVSYAFQVRQEHTNMAGIAHGGMLMSFADMVVAQAAFAANGSDHIVTLSMNVSFLAPARIGDLVECRPGLIRQTAEILFIDGDFRAGEEVILTVKSLWKTIRMRPKTVKN